MRMFHSAFPNQVRDRLCLRKTANAGTHFERRKWLDGTPRPASHINHGEWPDVLTAKLRTTALHATDQAVETLRRLPEDLRRPTTVFLCVTFKQLNIGDGEALRDLTNGTEEHAHERWTEPQLPPNHMFHPSVSEIELRCGGVRAGVPLSGLFRRIILDNQCRNRANSC